MTNGPWKWNGSVLVDADGICIGVVDLMTEEHRRAVAALPEVKAALKESLALLYRLSWGDNEATTRAHNALAKLKGI